MDFQQLMQWAEKAQQLKKKYEEEKKSIMQTLLAVQKQSPSTIEQALVNLQQLIEKKQLPLYRNVFNYGSMALGYLHKDSDTTDDAVQQTIAAWKNNLSLFVKLSEHWITILNSQKDLIDNIIRTKHYEALNDFFSLWQDENQINKDIKEQTDKMRALCMQALAQTQQVMTSLLVRGVQVQMQVQRRKGWWRGLYFASQAAMILMVFTNQDIFQLLRYYAEWSARISKFLMDA